MLIRQFSSEEKQLIKEVLGFIIDSRTRVIDERHPILVELMEEFPEITMMDLAFTAVETIITCEQAQESPELCSSLDIIDLISAQFIILKMIPGDKHQQSRAAVMNYFSILISAKKQLENLN